MITNSIQLVLAIVIGLAGATVGYGIGHEIGYVQGRSAGIAMEATLLSAQGEQLAREAEAARQPASLPGSLQRLRSQWCRDC